MTRSRFERNLPAGGSNAGSIATLPTDFTTRTWLIYTGFGIRRDQISEMEFFGSTFGASSERSNRSIDRISVGFPLPCLQANLPWDAVAPPLKHHSLITRCWRGGVPLRASPPPSHSHCFPIRPMGVPFAINVVAWTALCWMFRSAWRRARSQRRRRRNLCLSCGYARAGLGAGAPCPECGLPAPAATISP